MLAHILAVLLPKRGGGEKVKRVSQIFQRNGEKGTGGAMTKKTTPTLRLHPAIQSAIESFLFSELEHVKTDVKQSLPTKLGKASTSLESMLNDPESAIFVPLCVCVCVCGGCAYYYHTTLFLDIEREKKEMAEAEKREQVSSDDEEVHGFW
jgi:6-phosphogluconate dehydrogenase